MYEVILTLTNGDIITGRTEDAHIADSMFSRFGRFWGKEADNLIIVNPVGACIRSFEW